MKIGLGITTYNRPDYLKQCLEGVIKHLLSEIDVCYIYNDGSKKGKAEYKEIYKSLPEKIKYKHNTANKGIAHAKNYLLKRMMEEGCDYLFLLEDDIIPLSPKAITGYVKKSQQSGIDHFLFAHHGTMNVDKLYLRSKGIDLYTACVGAYCMYSRKAIEKAGYYDENLKNAYDHVEHTFRIQKAGYTTPWPLFPDLTKSKDYLMEIPDSIENTSIARTSVWLENVVNSLEHWKAKDKMFPLQETLDKLTNEMDILAV